MAERPHAVAQPEAGALVPTAVCLKAIAQGTLLDNSIPDSDFHSTRLRITASTQAYTATSLDVRGLGQNGFGGSGGHQTACRMQGVCEP
jgi:hypothetical protein